MGTNCTHTHDQPGLGGAGLKAELKAAEGLCVAERQRLTEPRRRALEMLLRAGQPVKAYDLLPKFHAGGRAAKPPTVYRALEFLERHGLAHRIESLNAYVACRRVGETHAAAFLIWRILGFHPLLLPTFIIELLPVADILPTWTGCVALVIALRRRQQISTPPAAPGTVIDV